MSVKQSQNTGNRPLGNGYWYTVGYIYMYVNPYETS